MLRFEVRNVLLLQGQRYQLRIMLTHSPVCCVEADADFFFFQTIDDDGTFLASVVRDCANWLFKCTKNDVHACFSSPSVLSTAATALIYVDKRCTTTGYDTFFNCCTSRVQSIFDAKFALFQFCFSSRADFDNCYAASKFSKTLLQLLFVELGSCFFQLCADLANACMRYRSVSPAPSTMIVFSFVTPT